jgi:hypothetical protein
MLPLRLSTTPFIASLSSLSRRVVCLPANPQPSTGPHRSSSDIQLFNQYRHATPAALLVSALPHISDMRVIQLSS